jgi:hypothetical protein
VKRFPGVVAELNAACEASHRARAASYQRQHGAPAIRPSRWPALAPGKGKLPAHAGSSGTMWCILDAEFTTLAHHRSSQVRYFLTRQNRSAPRLSRPDESHRLVTPSRASLEGEP